MLSELAVLIQDAKDVEEAYSFLYGVGTTVYPEGIIAGLAASSWVGTEGDGFAADDIYRFVRRLPPRFRAGAQFLANPLVYDTIAQFEVGLTSDQRMYLRGNGGNPGSLLSWLAQEASDMSDEVTTAAELLMVFGNWKYFLIVDKVGLSVEDAGFVRDGNGKLTGERALFIHYRNSSIILADNAFRMLKTGVVTTN